MPFPIVAEILAERIASSGRWRSDRSGFYEEVPALELEKHVLGFALFLIEQRPSEVYTFEGRFAFDRKDLTHKALDISESIKLLVGAIEGFQIEK
jgi:hypothetical protein